MIDSILNYLQGSTVISIGVLLVLSFYFILVFWIFVYKYFQLSSDVTTEQNNVNTLLSREATLNSLSRTSGILVIIWSSFLLILYQTKSNNHSPSSYSKSRKIFRFLCAAVQ